MPMIEKKDAEQLAQVFSALPNPVKLILFTQANECEYCSTTHSIMEEISALSDKIELQVYDFVDDKAKADEYGVDKIPATIIEGDKFRGIRFYGVPAGYEFTALIEDIIDVAKGAPDLPAPLLEELGKLEENVHLQVAVSPTCPYCPAAVRSAHSLALASDKIEADMLEISEFPHLAVKYGVQGVPHTIINETGSVVGGIPPADMFQAIKEALDK